jgi:hypothetical protein
MSPGKRCRVIDIREAGLEYPALPRGFVDHASRCALLQNEKLTKHKRESSHLTPVLEEMDTAPLVRDYQRAIDNSREDFNAVHRETTLLGATAGAFQGNASGPKNWKPSAYDIFTAWANDSLKALIALKNRGALDTLFTGEDVFEKWHESLVASLSEFWKSKAHADFPLSRRQTYKLVDLFVKWLRIKVPADIRQLIELRAHTTLNAPALVRVSALLGDETLAFAPDAEFDSWYVQTQVRIRAFTSAHGGSPVLVDVWCRAAALGDPDVDE